MLILAFYANGQAIKPLEIEWVVEDKDDTYFKDINNELDKFVGTWRDEDTATNTIFEITFTKELQAEGHKNGYVDELSAQFKLIINGVEQYNTYVTPCEECFIPSRFCFFKEDEIVNNQWVFTQPSVNMFVGTIAEPAIERHVLSSDLKLVYQEDIIGSLQQLVWTNKVSYGRDYVTDEIVNNYQMPLEMVLIKQ